MSDGASEEAMDRVQAVECNEASIYESMSMANEVGFEAPCIVVCNPRCKVGRSFALLYMSDLEIEQEVAEVEAKGLVASIILPASPEFVFGFLSAAYPGREDELSTIKTNVPGTFSVVSIGCGVSICRFHEKPATAIAN